MPRPVPRRLRRRVFGRDPRAYDRARLAYPPRVYEVLETRCGLRPGTRVFEIGPGTGIATRELLARGADPLTVVEADPRLARYLYRSLGPDAAHVRWVRRPFERALLPRGEFDLGVAASSFHWLPERHALRRVARALRSGGWWATWNNLHGDPYRASPFHRALQPLYRELAGERGKRARRGWNRAYFAADRRQRYEALRSIGLFEHIAREDIRWSVTLTTPQLRALWASFSDIAVLPVGRRTWFLRELARVARDQFGGRVTFPMLTPLYTARRT